MTEAYKYDRFGRFPTDIKTIMAKNKKKTNKQTKIHKTQHNTIPSKLMVIPGAVEGIQILPTSGTLDDL